MHINDFLNFEGIPYQITRNGQPFSTEIGLNNFSKSTKRSHLDFRPDADVIVGDFATSPDGKSVEIIETNIVYMAQQPFALEAYYSTDYENTQQKKASSHQTFHINNAYGSVIGSDNVATINYTSSIPDMRRKIEAEAPEYRESLQKIVDLLEMIVDNQITPTKGLLSKFSSVMERNSWISSAVASTLLTWLTSTSR